jgi:hypothetical protein
MPIISMTVLDFLIEGRSQRPSAISAAGHSQYFLASFLTHSSGAEVLITADVMSIYAVPLN